MAEHPGTPLHRKLGITAESRVLLDGAPDGFDLGAPELPPPHPRPGHGPYDVVLCFCPDAARLRRRYPSLHRLTTPSGALWTDLPRPRDTSGQQRVVSGGPFAWPERSSGVATDLDENLVRDHALANGRVDVKVCAVDELWSGLNS